MDKVLEKIRRTAATTQNWYELAIGVLHLCDYIAKQAAQLAALEQRLEKMEKESDD